MKETRRYFSMLEICQHTGLSSEIIYHYIQQEWITPSEEDLDTEDLARICLIIELKRDFGVNDEAIPVILHLIDQLHAIKNQVLRGSEDDSET